MRQYLIQRLLLAIPTIVLVTILIFLLTRVMPGDPAVFLAGTDATRSDIEAVRQEFHLDEPLPIQYLRWVNDLLHGDLGRSVRNARLPVTTVLQDRIQATLELGLLTLVLSVSVSVPLGVLAAYKRNTLWDHASTTLSLLTLSLPNFVLAYLLIFVVSLRLGLLPSAGYVPLTQDPVENLKYMVLPALVLSSSALAGKTRLLRTSVLEILNQDYVVVARSKGLSERVTLLRHVLKNAMIPFITIVGV
jgi:peptide/nickel transport system permease protein